MQIEDIYTIVTKQELEEAQMDSITFQEIIDDYSLLYPKLKKIVALYADLVQDNDDVNSIKYRVKTPSSLGRKIIRKRIEAIEKGKESKYLTITASNYKKIVTDLIGIRVIYLFKHYWKSINEHILNTFNVDQDEPIIIYHVGCDDMSFYFKDTLNYKEKAYHYKHDDSKISGYRSTHYLAFDPISDIRFEIQTRTIFEDSWSEIDHDLRYPNNVENRKLSDEMILLNSMVDKCQEKATRAFEIDGDRLNEFEQQLLDSELKNEVKSPTKKEITHVVRPSSNGYSYPISSALYTNPLHQTITDAKKALDMLASTDYQKILNSQAIPTGAIKEMIEKHNNTFSALEQAKKTMEIMGLDHRALTLQQAVLPNLSVIEQLKATGLIDK